MARAEVVRDYGGVSAEDRRAERRRKLLEAARQLWGDSGINDVTVRGVCAAAGLTPRYFYEHFANRDALVLAVADEVRSELFSTLVDASLAAPGGLEDKLKAALTAMFDLIAGDPRIHRVMTSDASGAEGLAQLRRETLDIVADLILQHGAALVDLDQMYGDAPRRVARFVVGGVNQLVEAWLREPKEASDELAEICTRLCLAVVGASTGHKSG